MFVADVSLITPPSADRPAPNPNVLIELGFAIRARGWEHVVMVFNEDSGFIDDLPFDLRGRRVISYRVKPEDEKAPERRKLEGQLAERLRQIFEHQLTTDAATQQRSIEGSTIQAIDEQAAIRLSRIRVFRDDINQQLLRDAPDLTGPSPAYEALHAALIAHAPCIASFARVAAHGAIHDDREILTTLFHGLEQIVERYHLIGSGTYYESQFSYWRCLGYQLLVVLIAVLLRERRWGTIDHILRRDLILRTT